MLITNYSSIFKVLGRQFGGLTSPLVYRKPEVMRNFYTQSDNTNIEQIKRDSFPTGTNPPYCYILGNKGSLLSATTLLNGEGSITTNLSSGINIESALTGSGTITDAQLSLIISLTSNLSGSGTITTANLVGIVSLASSLAGTGSLTAGLNVIAFMNSVLAGTGSLNADLRGKLSMSANIYVNQSEETVQQIVDGVWNALTINYNNPGTTGEALNAAGTAGDPWLTPLPGAYGVGTAGYIIGNGSAPSAAAIAAAVWDELQAGHITADTYGKIMTDLEILVRQVKALTSANL